ncbi:MAG: methyl-accepting chemotaxis protein [Desulfobacterales bacterium]|nr:methyl-accepting chemotaxis protein [Desulfobacterales bacterium]MDD4071127.1 methyl-accepting chemotaxis protein [Desulfobacterales bacterium]
MFRQFGIRSKFLVGLGAMLLIVAILSGSNIYFLHKISSQLELMRTSDANSLSQTVSSLLDVTSVAFYQSGILCCIGLIAFVSLGLLFSKTFFNPLRDAVEGFSQSACHLTGSSNQLTEVSKSLAEGASLHAASIEATSSSLEEISSMTKQNSDNACQADILMKEVNGVVQQANDTMSELTRSMKDISEASEETSKIIKTIDEIAFQTNLLALNAAVEAARAGEAGAGFAVVADEVRNLAMRAAGAAQNTSTLIEGTVKKIQKGSYLVTKTNEAFCRVAESDAKVGELVAEIATASKEQADGIEQINKVVVEMDRIIQQNTSDVQVSASASVTMKAHTGEIEDMVAKLVALVKGSLEEEIDQDVRPGMTGPRAAVQRLEMQRKPAESTKRPALPKKSTKPEDIIPFDDDDFKDF